jgi:hypothetical protein
MKTVRLKFTAMCTSIARPHYGHGDFKEGISVAQSGATYDPVLPTISTASVAEKMDVIVRGGPVSHTASISGQRSPGLIPNCC